MHHAFACALALGTILAGAEPQSNPSWDTFASNVKKGKTLAVTLGARGDGRDRDRRTPRTRPIG